jgi:peroxiredoxin
MNCNAGLSWRAIVLTLFGLTQARPAAAQEQAPPVASERNPLAGHSMHGEAFNEGPRQRAYLMNGTGGVHIEVTTKSPEAQRFFDQAVGQLHGFWYFEAERSFRQVAAIDTDCAMAYWGMAMANFENEKRAKAFIAKAAERKSRCSRREQLWIDGLNRYFTAGGDATARRREYIRSLETIIHEFPDELEAKAFLAWAIWVNSSRGLAISSHQAVESLLAEIFRTAPMHPAHHFRVHLWDNEKAQRALPSAARCGQSSPAIAHMWHMSGHTYSKLQRYADAAWQQEASARVDHAYMIRDRVLPYQIHNYAHNNQWLVTDLSHVGRVHEAVDLAKNLIEMPRHPRFNHMANFGSAAREGRSRLIEVLTRYELWDEILTLADTSYLEPTELFDEQVRRWRIIGAARLAKGDLARGTAVIAELDAMLRAERAKQDDAAAEAEAKAKRDNQPADKIAAARNAATQPYAGRIRPLENALAELQAHCAIAQGRCREGADQLAKVDGYRKSHLARAYLVAGDPTKAEQLARDAANQGKNEVEPLAQWVDILYRAGKMDEAAAQFKQLQVLAAQADLDVPALRRIDSIASALHQPADWRVPYATPDDVGERPTLDSLGPFRWHPAAAPDWTLRGIDGRDVTRRDYHGKPLVLIFYLGAGCLHCTEQINLFARVTREYTAAGLNLLAISTDTPEAVRKSIETGPQDGGFPFPLVPDPSLQVFKRYRVYDDFELRPLHGTFLIDGAGLIRWQDISYEPFREPKFLLDEARRLLSQPAERTRLARS